MLNLYILLNINIYFTNLTGKFYSKFLSLKYIYSTYTSNNISKLFYTIIMDFKISNILRYTISNNIKNNNNTIIKLFKLIFSNKKPAF